jgi:hypothetical protein
MAFDAAGLHQPDVVAELDQLPCPVMRTRASFHADQACRLALKELEHLAALELTTQDSAAFGINAVQLENRLRQIDPDCGNIDHGWLPLLAVFTAPNMAHRDAGSGSHPLHQWSSNGSIGEDGVDLGGNRLDQRDEEGRDGNPVGIFFQPDKGEFARAVNGHEEMELS